MGASQALYVAGQLRILSQSRDRVQDALAYGIAGAWSRRITEEHRLVYQVLGADIVILQARYHYGK